MTNHPMNDWANDLIAKIGGIDGAEDDAMRAFCRAYAEGDSDTAADKFAATAIREVWRGPYVEYTFADGSRYRDSGEGIDRFYPPAWDRRSRDIDDDDPWED